MSSRPQPSHDGSDALLRYLENYRRISLSEACQIGIGADDNIGIWAKDAGQWRKFTRAEQTMRLHRYKRDKSACRSIITNYFGLQNWQYERIRDSFEHADRKTRAGIYRRKERYRAGPEFVIVVELPDYRREIGVGAGLASAAVIGAGLHHLISRKSNSGTGVRAQMKAGTSSSVSRSFAGGSSQNVKLADPSQPVIENPADVLANQVKLSPDIKKHADELANQVELSTEIKKPADAIVRVDPLLVPNKASGVASETPDLSPEDQRQLVKKKLSNCPSSIPKIMMSVLGTLGVGLAMNYAGYLNLMAAPNPNIPEVLKNTSEFLSLLNSSSELPMISHMNASAVINQVDQFRQDEMVKTIFKEVMDSDESALCYLNPDQPIVSRPNMTWFDAEAARVNDSFVGNQSNSQPRSNQKPTPTDDLTNTSASCQADLACFAGFGPPGAKVSDETRLNFQPVSNSTFDANLNLFAADQTSSNSTLDAKYPLGVGSNLSPKAKPNAEAKGMVKYQPGGPQQGWLRYIMQLFGF